MELLLVQTKQLFQFGEKKIIIIGRSPSCDFLIHSRLISRIHVTLVISDLGCILNDGDLKSDRYSSNGIKMNGRLIDPPSSQILKNGDEFELSPQHLLKFFDIKKLGKDSEPTLS
ncbi:MAG: FHA domain-containing protein [Potamolinea sp.]